MKRSFVFIFIAVILAGSFSAYDASAQISQKQQSSYSGVSSGAPGVSTGGAGFIFYLQNLLWNRQPTTSGTLGVQSGSGGGVNSGATTTPTSVSGSSVSGTVTPGSLGVSSGATTPSTNVSSSPIDLSSFKAFVASIVRIINIGIMPVLVAIGIVLFLWGLVKYVSSADDTKKRSEGIRTILWGLVTLAIIFSIWGIVKILGNTFGISVFIPQF